MPLREQIEKKSYDYLFAQMTKFIDTTTSKNHLHSIIDKINYFIKQIGKN